MENALGVLIRIVSEFDPGEIPGETGRVLLAGKIRRLRRRRLPPAEGRREKRRTRFGRDREASFPRRLFLNFTILYRFCHISK